MITLSDQQKELACIFCGRSRPLRTLKLEKLGNWDIGWVVLQVREIRAGPGRGRKGEGGGFPAIRAEGLSILQMAEREEYREVVDAVKNRLIKIVRAYLQAGIIKESELR